MSKKRTRLHKRLQREKLFYSTTRGQLPDVSLLNCAVEEGATVLDTSSFHVLANVW